MTTTNPLDLLAEFLTGADVVHHSLGLGLREGTYPHAAAHRFFDLRAAFNIAGYANAHEARESITHVLQKKRP